MTPIRGYQAHLFLCIALAGIALALPTFAAEFASQSVPVTSRSKASLEAPKPLALPRAPAIVSRTLSGTGFFVDDMGHLLTASHVVQDCGRIVVVKQDHRVAAVLVARSPSYDLTLLKVPRTLGLSAIFPHAEAARSNDMVFADAYDRLPGERITGVLANARVVATPGEGEPGHLSLASAITFGASGAPVLDRNGLVEGLISRRTQDGRVLAVGLGAMKSFLAANGVAVHEDDRPQLDPLLPRADRAASLSARIICWQNR